MDPNQPNNAAAPQFVPPAQPLGQPVQASGAAPLTPAQPLVPGQPVAGLSPQPAPQFAAQPVTQPSAQPAQAMPDMSAAPAAYQAPLPAASEGSGPSIKGIIFALVGSVVFLMVIVMIAAASKK